MIKRRFILSGGGTGGHVFPAIAIAKELTRRYPDSEILFVGALGKMEMERVPASGYSIKGLPISGLHRGEVIRNLMFIPRLVYSLWAAFRIVKSFNPSCVIGVGGYASWPVLRVATWMSIPTVIQEQNSYAGIVNRFLGKSVSKVCVAYEGMDRFFPSRKIVFTGNPVREEVKDLGGKAKEGMAYFNVKSGCDVLLVVGGSLGARSINTSLVSQIDLLVKSPVQVIWQTGKLYYSEIKDILDGYKGHDIRAYEFISRMDLAYAVANLVVSRAGAGVISELCMAKKPVILVPSPNVAEDHQRKNAVVLSEKGAAMLVEDSKAKEELIPSAIRLIKDKERLSTLAGNVEKLSTPRSTERIVDVIEELIG